MSTEIMIGLEIHCSLDTDSKLFCSCPKKNEDGEKPNTRTCPTCLGHPGSKPSTNRKAVEHAVKIALALGCEIATHLRFARKSYFYPDLPKNYQITQYEHPIGSKGSISLSNGRIIKVTRAHLEEDPGAIIDRKNHVLIDYNRCGTPLMEIVTEPDIGGPEEARQLVRELQSILHYLRVFSPGRDHIKVDANISIRESGFTRVEIKNILGQKDLHDALKYEILRQRQVIEEGGSIRQETRHWDEKTRSTMAMRPKEEEDDYGYIEEPDLVPTPLHVTLVQDIKKSIPELPLSRSSRIIQEHGIDVENAHIICANPVIADLYESLAKEVNGKVAAKWVRREILGLVGAITESDFTSYLLMKDSLAFKELVILLNVMITGKITAKTTRDLLEDLLSDIKNPLNITEYIDKHNLGVINNTDGKLLGLCQKAISKNQAAVGDFKSGKGEALNFLLGAVMRESGGKADPSTTKKILKNLLEDQES